jgi:hypothetical protein
VIARYLGTRCMTAVLPDGSPRADRVTFPWRKHDSTVPGYKVHDGSLAGWEPQGGQGHVPVEEAALVDEPQDLRLAHLHNKYVITYKRRLDYSVCLCRKGTHFLLLRIYWCTAKRVVGKKRIQN